MKKHFFIAFFYNIVENMNYFITAKRKISFILFYFNYKPLLTKNIF